MSGNRINISNWQIVDKNGNIKIVIPNNTWIDSQAFYLLERSDDATIPYLSANLIYTGALVNNNEELQLFDSNCNLIDRVAANPD
ncbi:MAG TPA: hypothetical protein P5241_00865 [Candidatus Paceibacterota bacterium]|nr:hypothetical protein [Candidatus Paceibacterota bacterium]